MSAGEIAAFAALFAAYQLPEGVGQHLLGSFVVQATLLLAFFPLAYVIGRWLRGSATHAYALERFPGNTFLKLFLLACAAKAGALAIGRATSTYLIAVVPATALFTALPAAALMTVFPSVAEDIVTRGFWFRLRRWTGARFVVMSSAVYVANHIYRLQQGPVEWLMLFAFGLAYAAAVVRFNSLWPAVALHWGWNFANEWLGRAVRVTTQNPDAGRLLSAAAHLALLAVVLAWPVSAVRRSRAD